MNGRPFTPEEDHHIRKRRAEGATWAQIGRELGRAESGLQRRSLRPMDEDEVYAPYWVTNKDRDRLHVQAVLAAGGFPITTEHAGWRAMNGKIWVEVRS